MMSTHIDDIKGSATDEERNKLATILKKHFGDDLKNKTESFEFTGIQHAQATNKSITTHQDHYIKELSIIPLESATANDNPDDPATTEENEAFNSLLGGIAWTLMTRSAMCPYVGYLQRLNRQPKRQHLVMINKLLKYMKRHSTCLHYKRLPGAPYVLVIADSAYQSNESDPEALAMRGFFIFLAHHPQGKIGGHLQLVDFVSRRLHVVARSAFAAELRNVLEAIQESLNVATWFHEIYRGPLTAEECTHVRDKALHFLPVKVCMDNYGLFAAVTKDEPTAGSDASMIYHVKAVRYLCDKGSIDTMAWIDNRDMLADGLTKGNPPRDPINTAMATAYWEPQQDYETWTAKSTHGTATTKRVQKQTGANPSNATNNSNKSSTTHNADMMLQLGNG